MKGLIIIEIFIYTWLYIKCLCLQIIDSDLSGKRILESFFIPTLETLDVVLTFDFLAIKNFLAQYSLITWPISCDFARSEDIVTVFHYPDFFLRLVEFSF